MPWRPRTLAVAAVLAVASGVATGALAASPVARTARLQGTYAMTGVVTAARHVRGEHRGQHVSRVWTFTPLCATGPCRTIQLQRQRPRGADTLRLKLVARNQYAGRGRFYVPVRCGQQIYRRGESVPFRVKVRIMSTAATAAGPVATAIVASYTNRRRHNLTPCVEFPGHDAARYSGAVVSQ